MKDFKVFIDHEITIGRCESILGDPYWYVKSFNKVDCCEYVEFFKKFNQVLLFLENYYDESEV